MVKTQTKVAIAILGTALISLVFWDRSNKQGLDPEPVEEFVRRSEFDDDPSRFFPRHKRQSVGPALHAVYKQFSKLEDCCKIPKLIPADALDACNSQGQRIPAKKRAKNPAGGNWLNRIQNQFFGGGNQATRKNKNGGKPNTNKQRTGETTKSSKRTGRQAKKGSAQKISLNAVLNETALDLNLIEETYVNKLQDKDWKQVVQDAMYTCEEPAACANPDKLDVGGKTCNIKPTIMHNCMQKQMMLNCPDKFKSKNFKCNAGMSSLKQLNTLNYG